ERAIEDPAADEHGDPLERAESGHRVHGFTRLVLRADAPDTAEDSVPARHQSDDHVRRPRARLQDVRARALPAVPCRLPRGAVRLERTPAILVGENELAV